MKVLKFEGALGNELSGRLELPDAEVRAFAVFAHCFTCSKNTFAASRVAKALSGHGVAVLRFDFTGLGESGGEFSETNFTSNVEDLVAAADHLRDEYEAPSILIGHSFGGAAVLCAAHQIPEVRAVATIAAPFDPGHVEHLLGDVGADIAGGETCDVEIGGRTFTIRPQFLEDISNVDAAGFIGRLDCPLMIFHSPTDKIVGIENAGQIFKAARHPKSFVALDGVDHLVSKSEDAAFIASILATWADRYVGDRSDPDD